MAAKDSKVLKSSAVVVAILFVLGCVCSASSLFYFGSSKVRPLFGSSAEALAGPGGQGLQKKKAVGFTANDAGF